MKWLNHFSEFKIPFCLYHLKQDDAIIYSSNTKNNKSFIVIHGIIYLAKVFSNEEILIQNILSEENIISNTKKNVPYYYSIVAIKETFLLSFIWEDFIYYNKTNYSLKNITNLFKSTISQYDNINIILAHKCTKQRIIQLILFLACEYGFTEKNKIQIPFYISQTTISIIIGSNRHNVSMIIKNLLKTNKLAYNYQKKIYIRNIFKLCYEI